MCYIIRIKINIFIQDLAQFMKGDNVLTLKQTSSSTLSLAASSDEAYGSDKSSIGEELRGRTSRLNSKESKMARSRSSDVRAGKFLNKLRGQKFSGLRPEEFAPSTKELNESSKSLLDLGQKNKTCNFHLFSKKMFLYLYDIGYI